MDQAWTENLPLPGICMALFYSQDESNDMTKSGQFCPKDGNEMEKVSGHNRYTCHWCGGIREYDKEGKESVWFEGAQ